MTAVSSLFYGVIARWLVGWLVRVPEEGDPLTAVVATPLSMVDALHPVSIYSMKYSPTTTAAVHHSSGRRLCLCHCWTKIGGALQELICRYKIQQ